MLPLQIQPPLEIRSGIHPSIHPFPLFQLSQYQNLIWRDFKNSNGTSSVLGSFTFCPDSPVRQNLNLGHFILRWAAKFKASAHLLLLNSISFESLIFSTELMTPLLFILIYSPPKIKALLQNSDLLSSVTVMHDCILWDFNIHGH